MGSIQTILQSGSPSPEPNVGTSASNTRNSCQGTQVNKSTSGVTSKCYIASNSQLDRKNNSSNVHQTFSSVGSETACLCGWGRFRPKFLQNLGNIKWYVAVISLCGATQGMVCNGFVNTVISTLERRYELSSKESGLIASSYDIMFVLLVIPISFFGGHGNKIKYLGAGMFVIGLGSLVFSLPYFISGLYEVGGSKHLTCQPKNPSQDICNDYTTAGSLSNYKYFFYLGQLMHGAGSSALYTLGISYIDENVSKRMSPFYNGIFYACAIVGPAIGYMVGSALLNIYVDFNVDPATLGLNTQNQRWVGAWWIGFLISSLLGVLLSIPLLAFPSRLPGYYEFQSERSEEVHDNKSSHITEESSWLKDLKTSMRCLFTNIPFMMINFAGAANGALMAGFSTFIPKYIEYLFGVSSGKAAFLVGLVVVPAGGGSMFLGGWLIHHFDWHVRAITKLCIFSSVLMGIVSLAMFMECDTSQFAGVNVPYGEINSPTSFLGKDKLDSSCNEGCHCAKENYYPICGRDGVLYFSPCHAGCTDTLTVDSIQRFTNCSCVMYDLTSSDLAPGGDISQGEFGKCENQCKWLYPFMFMFSIQIVLLFIVSMPSLTITLRTLPVNRRSFGLGIQWIVARCFGSIPGPLLFGWVFDWSCLLWQQRCEGEGSCFFYDNQQVAHSLLTVAIIFSLIAAVAFYFALISYKQKRTSIECCEEIAINASNPDIVTSVATSICKDETEEQFSNKSV